MRATSLIFVVALVSTNAAAQSTQTATPQTNQAPAPHPQPAHTGWASLLKDTGQDFLAFPKRQSTWMLLGIGAAGALATHPADGYVERHVTGNNVADNIFTLGQWVGSTEVQVGTAVGLWAVGRYVLPPTADQPRTNKVSHLGFDLLRAHILSQVLVQGMKYSVRRDRPTGECCAFPSGHAATAFAAASVLERHLGYRASWPALLGATYVGASRLVDNRHFVSDVVFGAAVGVASGWTVVGRHGRESYALQPIPLRGGMIIMLTRINDEDRRETLASRPGRTRTVDD
jgi:membrane-associated phospholipid phosphatase